jgi:hypothetical protein
VSCKKKDQNYYVQNSFKEWTLFKKGSYWVYLNETSNKPDSCFVIENAIDRMNSDEYGGTLNQGGIYYEIISYNIFNVALFELIARDNDSYLLCEGFAGHDFINSYRVTSNLSQEVNVNCVVKKRYDTLVINNNKFVDVIQTQDSESTLINNHFYYSISNYFFAKNIGLIKFANKDSTWSLVRWHVLQ